MSTLTLSPRLFDATGTLFEEPVVDAFPSPRPRPAQSRRTAPAGGPTLEDLIVAEWEQISAGAAVSCPICHSEMRPVWAAGPRPVGGCCQDCGSSLS